MHPQDTPGHVIEDERALVAELAGVSPSEIEFNDTGWESRVFIVGGGEAVFKFPRSEDVRSRYATQVTLLKRLADLELPVKVPVVKWEGPDLSYLGYLGIVGAHPTSDTSEARQEEIGRTLGEFLRILHAQSVPAPRASVHDEVAMCHRKYELALPYLQERFSQPELDVLDAFFAEELPDAMTRLGEEPRLCHGDLGAWNVLIDGEGGLGIIDFDVCYVDHSNDFVALLSPWVLRGALDAYGASDVLREKVAVRQRAFPVTDLQFFIGKKDAEGIAAGIERIRGTFFGSG
jgi:Ser/Thr protein kinase RdoA (MazF antagonist)